ncbi:pimeloyl-ACP methyl ester carboxylesterase [Methylobacterium brachiatum]|uniref:Pimeloyl-ACP methyl ester carboxylesterase n=1 Tax=Methylobacterium brachiatum TaxID=269660 RepID=A0AAJ1U2H7_9HYPH|nr:alpha/beta hydrolase [Methylobacterium brachiatum]MCB4805581.1 alpha/beta hydrolase [Methylobacterium brachiatum]MDQ0546768.1 pimeloyl-ACP methyl ester carboxylesterase [Methylobacterium brachiatum]
MPKLRNDGRTLDYEIVDFVPPWNTRAGTIIFHHGVGVDRHLWRQWIPILAGAHRIILFDMFGWGAFPATEDERSWSAPSRVDDVLALADAVKARTFHLVGESYGGTIALMVALRAPGRVETLTISNAAHVGSSIAATGIWERLLSEGGVQAWSNHMMEQRFFPDTLPPDMELWFAAQQAACESGAIRETLKALVAVDIAAEVSRLSMPVLLLHPDSSPFISVALMADLHGRLHNSEMQVFAHARHGLPFSHGRECATVLKRFLDRHASLASAQAD